MLAVGLLTLTAAPSAQGAAEVGSPAPDFCLPASQGDKVCLKDFKGKDNIVLLFYVLDFTPG
jgi:peroxiredoxin